jgi:hypothetical protein
MSLRLLCSFYTQPQCLHKTICRPNAWLYVEIRFQVALCGGGAARARMEQVAERCSVGWLLVYVRFKVSFFSQESCKPHGFSVANVVY